MDRRVAVVRRAIHRGLTTALATGLVAGLAGPAHASSAEALLEVAGAARHVQAWPEVSLAARERAQAALDADAWALLQREVARTFRRDALQERLERELSDLDGDALVRSFVLSGAAGVLGPGDAYAAAMLRDFPVFASQVSSGEVPPTRFGLIARLEDDTGFARNAWRTSAAVARAFERGARVLSCSGGSAAAVWTRPPTEREAQELFALAQPFRERVHVELLFAVRQRSGAELQRALRFLESEPARDFHRRLEVAVADSLAAAMRVLGERLGAEAADRCAG